MSREGLVASVGISEAADRTGLSAHTLRYYERAGLIQPTERGERGERRYASRDLRWVEFLQRLRATRMPVREMKQFAELRRGGAKTVAARRELLASHRRRVLGEIEQLRSNLRSIEAKLARLESGADLEEGKN
jgi:DNA-binding transcriptional MerR regulator